MATFALPATSYVICPATIVFAGICRLPSTFGVEMPPPPPPSIFKPPLSEGGVLPDPPPEVAAAAAIAAVFMPSAVARRKNSLAAFGSNKLLMPMPAEETDKI